ncbi:uncharacterized protein LOC122492642 [Prionailurus bengalensis]|uniref:uncharacterized protein LOC122492642 n=1 Tax=Prionailurus bengalensis TaxID=37029 RepID=UPI001CA92C26|nr:uncharacterized protein LOC122492642 [Prionailurus bengalensis]
MHAREAGMSPLHCFLLDVHFQVLAAHGPCELAAGDRWPPCGTRSQVAGSGVCALPLGPPRTPAGLVTAGERSTQGTFTPERGLDLGAVALREGTPRQENVRRGHLGPGLVGVVGTSSDSASLHLGCARSTVPGTRACQPPGCQRWARTAAVDLDPRAVEDVVSNKPGIPLITRVSERSVRVQNRYRRICTVRPRGRRHAVGKSFEVDTGLLRMEQILRHTKPQHHGEEQIQQSRVSGEEDTDRVPGQEASVQGGHPDGSPPPPPQGRTASCPNSTAEPAFVPGFYGVIKNSALRELNVFRRQPAST